MHPLVRDLYKRALHVGQDYPHPEGMAYVRRIWKAAIQNEKNCPACYPISTSRLHTPECQKELKQAVARGRHMVREMIGVIQLKKYRTMKARYSSENQQQTLEQAMDTLEARSTSTEEH
jgi:hypothetical protein